MPLAAFRPPTAAYVHVPFCAHRCGYCDFTLVARRDDLIERYLAALERELESLVEPRPISTLFLGGGTPTHLSAPQLRRLLTVVCRWFRLSPVGEFTVEANPAGLSDEKLLVLNEFGVNRISLGVQSFAADVLRTLERDHDEPAVVECLGRLRGQFANVSLDLIFGVPGQTLALWRASLLRAIDLGPTHVSTYGLTYEKGTAFWSRRKSGTLLPLAPELERDMYALAMDLLPAAGLAQYELSNFSRPGCDCRHNATYWAGRPYFAAGPGAARYLDGRRETNHRSVTTWLARIEAGRSPLADSEQLAPEDRAREALVLGLRRTRGVNRIEFLEDTGFDLGSLTAGRIDRYAQAGWIECDQAGLRLTLAGRFVADSVAVDLL